jgi:D-lactate dehydrogenase (cytochrome)
VPTACIFYGLEDYDKVEGLVHRMVQRAIDMEGTITGEHGIGLVKRDFLPHEIGQDAVDAMRRVSVCSRLM